MRTRSFVAGVSALGLLAACGSTTDTTDAGTSAEGYPIVVENCDREVTIESPVERAVVINQPATELVLSLGLADRIEAVGVSDSQVIEDVKEDFEKVDKFDEEFPALERVLDVEPDLVYSTFAYTFTSEGIGDQERFDELGVPTYQSPSECGGQDAEQTSELSLDDLYDEIADVAELFDVQDAGDELTTELRDRAEAATEDLGAEDVSLAWWYSSTRTPYMAGCCGAPGLMTRAVGATNAFEDQRQLWPEIGWESILDRDPDVLVLADLERGDDGDSAEAKIAFLESDPVASRLTAVKERRYIILGGTTMDPSIRNVDGIEQIAEGLRDLGLVG
ncbi:ABC transporter substrate-binding protein [Aeromicrobium sp. YIM 150415]|uniref:ABC transporter substrate-binding protein n=1 Tax=Aeromicrobium piscarium TaxID=2590901 RepID=A0A554S816_9ACTN|nr:MULTISPECIES: ABC transporter substrate-binding protein [Aeromicrobium]MBM9464706.1 ABC transporter substrate-binding protein [Aeromicrobium sp. YIM 150415]TSD62476.1 ABC transporter substrate-binding protein [Aeromicrobium piscarium]